MRALWNWVRRLNNAVENRVVSTASARIVVPGGEGLSFTDFTTMENEGPIHRVGQPPESLTHFEWPTNPQYKSDMNAVSTEPQEWAGLLTYVFNRRIEALEEMTLGVEGTLQKLALPLCDRIDSSLMAPVDKDVGSGQLVTKSLKGLLSLSDNDYDALSAAIQMHYGAVLLSVRETNASYSLLVGAIELLSRCYGEVDTSWEGWSEAVKWEAKFRKLRLDGPQRDGMKKALLAENKHRNLKRSFVSYVESILPLEFWSEPIRDWIHTFDTARGVSAGGSWTDSRPRFMDSPTDSFIRKVLGGTYDARSEFVHAGKRRINLVEEMQIQAKPQLSKRLPIRAVRDALRAIIDFEMSKRGRSFVLPDVRRSPLWTPDGGSYI